MDKVSSYIKHLPPILWSSEHDSAGFLGRALCVFEEILTGLPDDHTPSQTGEPKQLSPGEIIADLPDLFDPFRTRSDSAFLRWLASWVALDLNDDWKEYQQRWLIDQISTIYRQRGLKEGLTTYLDIYETSRRRPRIVVDDGEAVHTGIFVNRDRLRLHAIGHSLVVSSPRVDDTLTALLHPSAVAVDQNNNYIVADRGGGRNNTVPPALWKITSTGRFDYRPGQGKGGSVPHPLWLGSREDPQQGQLELAEPVAVVVDNQDRYSVLDNVPSRSGSRAAIYRLDPGDRNPKVIVRGADFGAVYPVDMVQDRQGRYFVLDRGGRLRGFPPQGGSRPKIIVVTVVAEQPLRVEVETHEVLTAESPTGEVREIAEPTALALAEDGCLIIADANHQRNANPADLIRVNPANDWAAVSLLSAVDPDLENPLVFPTGLIVEGTNRYLVCDTGLALGFSSRNRSIRTYAKPPGIYRVDLSDPAAPRIDRLTQEKKLVSPTKMALDRRGRLVVVDQGESLRNRAGGVEREWRGSPNEFGVIMHFADTGDDTVTSDDIRSIRNAVEEIVEEQKPSHTRWWMEL